MNDRNARYGLTWATLLLLTFAPPAHAYMDPGSMSVIVTSILGAIAAVGYSVRLYWSRIKALIARMTGRSKADLPNDAE